MKFKYSAGATPLDPDEITGLIPEHITTQQELNEWEQANILDAERWLFSSHGFGYNVPTNGYSVAGIYRNKLNSLENFNVDFIKKIHKKMFNDTWRWAGKFRQSAKNIGIDRIDIHPQLHELLDNIKYQVLHQSYDILEIAVRLHHRLVQIHPFPNGNGRHARLTADYFLALHNHPRLVWGKNNLYEDSVIRKNYIAALQAADKHNFEPLLHFAKQ